MSASAWKWRRTDLGLLLVHAALAAFFVTGRAPGTDAAWGFPLDDAWIHLVYARSLAHFEGFAYNPGQLEAGFTSPLWVLLQAPLFWLTGGETLAVVLAVKLLGTVVALGVSLLAYRAVHALTADALAAFLAALLIATEPYLSFAKVSGMEVLLGPALLLLALWALAAQRPKTFALGLSLAALARPEMALPGALLALAYVRLAGVRRAPPVLAPTVLPGAAWVGWCLAVTGRPLPNTFYAKHLRTGLFANHLQLLTQVLPSQPWMLWGSGALLFAIGAASLLRKARDRDEWQRAAAALAVLLPLVTLEAMALTHAFPQSWPFYWNRYLQPALPLLALPIGCGLTWALRFAWSRLLFARAERRPSRLLVALPVLALAVLPWVRVPGGWRERAELYAWNCQNIDEMNVRAGLWLAEHTEQDQWVAANDAGAIRYFSDRPTLDLIGLNDHRVLQGGAGARVREVSPRYFALFPSLFANVTKDRSLRPVLSLRADRYTICDCPEQRELVIYQRDSSSNK